MAHTINGFDPLSGAGERDGTQKLIFERQTQRFVESILKSYTGFYDVFAETIQNAIDALERKVNAGTNFEPTIWIKLNIKEQKITVIDNGCGMNEEEFKYCFTPSVSFKYEGGTRGQKGVGATFLAYGYSYIHLQTKMPAIELAAILRQGRLWAEDSSGRAKRPTLEEVPFAVPELLSESSGTSVEVIVGKSPGERPRDLSWIGAQSAEQWHAVLRMKTAIGGVYLTRPPFRFKTVISVVRSDGTTDHAFFADSDYFYPHEVEGWKVRSLAELKKVLNRAEGDAQTKFAKLYPEYKRLDCIYDVWDNNDILQENSIFEQALSDEHRVLIERHRVAVYGAFLRSAKMWTELNDEILGLRKGIRLIPGGLQLASDYMVQGDLLIIPLTSTIGYQANSHVVVHFTDGNPDMGRKTFQPELKSLAEWLAVRVVNSLKRYLQHMKPDTGAQISAPTKELHEWIRQQETYRDQNPLSFSYESGDMALVSIPRQEQDVVALFHELIGMGVLRGIRFFGTSQSDRYDSLYYLNYTNRPEFAYNKKQTPLGVKHDWAGQFDSEPRVLEYKFDFESLMDDFAKEIKYERQINLVVCWKVGMRYRERFFLNSLLVGDEGTSRETYGATHQVFLDGGGFLFELIVLEDLVRYLLEPEDEEARQKTEYKD